MAQHGNFLNFRGQKAQSRTAFKSRQAHILLRLGAGAAALGRSIISALLPSGCLCLSTAILLQLERWHLPRLSGALPLAIQGSSWNCSGWKSLLR